MSILNTAVTPNRNEMRKMMDDFDFFWCPVELALQIGAYYHMTMLGWKSGLEGGRGSAAFLSGGIKVQSAKW